MPETHPISSLTEAERNVYDLYLKVGSPTKVAEILNRERSTVSTLLARARKKLGISPEDHTSQVKAALKKTYHKAPRFTPIMVDDIDLPELVDPEELWERRKSNFERRARFEESRRLIPAKVTVKGPIGLHFFGDPHVDDDTCDLVTLDRHTDVVCATDAMMACNVGDTTNNWIGRLARLYANQGTTAQEAWVLAEHWIKRVGANWLFLVGGNHDAWSGAGDPLNWICRQQDAIYQESQVRMQLAFPNGKKLTINCRHDFAGNSQWNPTHGPMKALQLGLRDDVNICGHKHKSGYGVVKDPDSHRVMHAIQVSSYKVPAFDDYSKQKGFADQHISPCVTLVIDPDSPNPSGIIHMFWEPEEAAEFLTWKRSRM